ncbi:MAG: hypothetical protein NTZ56_23315 [Acidobacteria bacterium]|nr:hypothetical protein [Acidobacteriota bacterium]
MRSGFLKLACLVLSAIAVLRLSSNWWDSRNVQAAHRQVAFSARSVIIEFPGTPREVKHAERMLTVLSDGTEEVVQSLKGRPLTDTTRRVTTPDGRTSVEVSPLLAKVSWWEDSFAKASGSKLRDEKRQHECAVPRRGQRITARAEFLGYPAVRVEEPRKPLNQYQIETVQWLIPTLDCFQAEISSKTYDASGNMTGEMLTRAVEIRAGESQASIAPALDSHREVRPSVLQATYEKFLGVEPCLNCGLRRENADQQYEKRQARP